MVSLPRASSRAGGSRYELDYFATYVGLEEDATTMKLYQSTTIPGLLQTPDYVSRCAGS